MAVFTATSAHGSDDQTAVMPAEAETVRNGVANALLARLVRDVIEIARGVWRVVIDRRMEHAVLQRQDAGDDFDAPGGAERVAQHALGAGDGQLAGVRAE